MMINKFRSKSNKVIFLKNNKGPSERLKYVLLSVSYSVHVMIYSTCKVNLFWVLGNELTDKATNFDSRRGEIVTIINTFITNFLMLKRFAPPYNKKVWMNIFSHKFFNSQFDF